MVSGDISDHVQRRHDMMNLIRRIVDHPAPFAALGGVAMVLALAQNDLYQMFSGLCCLIVAIWNCERYL